MGIHSPLLPMNLTKKIVKNSLNWRIIHGNTFPTSSYEFDEKNRQKFAKLTYYSWEYIPYFFLWIWRKKIIENSLKWRIILGNTLPSSSYEFDIRLQTFDLPISEQFTAESRNLFTFSKNNRVWNVNSEQFTAKWQKIEMFSFYN